MRKILVTLALPGMLFYGVTVSAATPIDLSKQSISSLRAFMPVRAGIAATATTDGIKETKRTVDFNKTTHIRVQQMHAGYPVWGADAVIHVPVANGEKPTLMGLAAAPATKDTDMNGVMYQDLNTDLNTTAASVFTDAQKQKAVKQVLGLAKEDYKLSRTPSNQTSQLMVYVDNANKAHWSFLVSLYFPATKQSLPVNPTYIIDAQTFAVYQQWNDIKSLDLEPAEAGGFGGNEQSDSNKIVYDGQPGHAAALNIMRDADAKRCYLQNADVIVKHGLYDKAVVNFPCFKPDEKHNHLFWNGEFDASNGGYSPSNDALFAGSVIKNMYQKEYKLPMLVDYEGKPMLLEMISHSPNLEKPYNADWQNAAWDDFQQAIFLGDGGDVFYPLTSLGVIAHEVSHGFTHQNSNLIYVDQSGALNEAFSDMAAQAAEQYAYQRSSWQIGSEIMKDKGTALRYLDQPSKDCQGRRTPGIGCSIDNNDQYGVLVKSAQQLPKEHRQSYIVHLASGVYNHFFYLLSNAPGWDVKKAFAVMAKANMDYWTKGTNNEGAACGVLKATRDFKYDTATVVSQFKEVKIDTKHCKF